MLVIPLRFERRTHALEGRCSIQLSYGTSLNCGAQVLLFIRIANFYAPFFIMDNKYIQNPHGRPHRYQSTKSAVQHHRTAHV